MVRPGDETGQLDEGLSMLTEQTRAMALHEQGRLILPLCGSAVAARYPGASG
jgi:hypothetical protein